MTAPSPAYVRLAKYVSNHDGDTVTLALDHGRYPDAKALTHAVLRLRGVKCPELSEPGGREAATFTGHTLQAASRIVVQTYKGSFARTLADVWVDGRLLADLLIEAGHGVRA